MSRRTVRSVDPLSRPQLTVVRGDAANVAEPAPERSDATDVLGQTLIDAFGDRVLFLFHRRIPGQTGDLPIIAVTSTGVHLIEPRSYPGKKVRACRDGSTFVIDGVRHTGIADQMREHAEALQATVSTGPLPDVSVHTSYCFVDGELPLRPLEIAGVRVLSVRSTLRRLRAGGPLDERQVEALHRDLSRRLVRT
ncbi:hypothetical protein [Aeromicrobium flavum]|nr:hypothetical protein [Aeromicrobium flavum]